MIAAIKSDKVLEKLGKGEREWNYLRNAVNGISLLKEDASELGRHGSTTPTVTAKTTKRVLFYSPDTPLLHPQGTPCDADILLNKTQVKAARRIIFDAVAEQFSNSPLNDGILGYKVSLSASIVWTPR